MDKAASLGIPEPELAVRANGAAMVVGGACLALDRAPRLAASLLAVTLVPTTVAGHPFWQFQGEQWTAQLVQFAKNLGLLGGLLLVIRGGRR